MATIIKKIKSKKPYYYAVESKRVNGKPRIVWQKYLGTLDDIVKKCTSPSNNVSEVEIFNAGGVAAMLGIAKKLSLIEIIDETIPKRNQGASIGQYIVLAAINRILAPCSKLKMSEWYRKSILSRLWAHDPEVFSSQMFWNHMDLVEERDIETIQEKLTEKVLKNFNVNPKGLLYDTTNFFTYIASGNKRNTIAKRGRSKAKRNDLRQVGLALLVSKDFHIPLFHKVYDGNKSDRGLFTTAANEITDWQDACLADFETTLVFDKGNFSEDALDRLIIGGKHYICAIPKTSCADLYSISIDSMKMVSGLPGTRAYSETIEIYNKKHKIVVSYSDNFFTSSMADLIEKLRKIETNLHDLDLWLKKGPSRPQEEKYYSKASIQAKLNSILSYSQAKEAIDVKIIGKKGQHRLEYQINQNKIDALMKNELGRTLIITTRLDWSESEIISHYRGQQGIENVFKHMKNKEYLHWQPEFHWTDSKIKVHALYCVLAMLIASLAHRELIKNGLDLSLIDMLDELNNIKEVALIYHKQAKQKERNQLTLSRLSPTQKKLSEILEIPLILQGTTTNNQTT